MPSDLRIQGIKLPSPVVGACPSDVVVDVVNVGADPAPFPTPMSVCLELRTSLEGKPRKHYVVHTPVETPPLQPGQIKTFVFTGVQFPCTAPVFVTATADCAGTVPNNAHLAPSLTETVIKVDGMPWLWTDIRVGLQDSTGFITWSPAELCPGATCVTEVTLRNAGCADAPASITALEVRDGAGHLVDSQTNSTPFVAAGMTTVLTFKTAVPVAVAGQTLTFRACADSTGVVTPQCDLVHTCSSLTLRLAAAAAPSLSFAATATIFPGDPIPLSWGIQNVCYDLGKITARILYQATSIHTSIPINVGLMDGPKGEDPLIDPSGVPPSFYKIGSSTLTLELTGTGNDPGPYTATTQVTVTAEPVSGTWAFTAPPTLAAWKAAYNVAGRLTNPAHATMTPSSVVLNETSFTQPPVSTIAMPSLGAIVTGGFGTAIWSVTQRWSWVTPGVWIIYGPTIDVFTYSVTFSMQDAYGNAYPSTTSSSFGVVVGVSNLKLGLAATALVLIGVAIALLIVGLAALGFYPTAGLGAALIAAAGVSAAIAQGFGAGALDPPVPNFAYRRVGSVRRPDVPEVVGDDPALASISSVFMLLSRIAEIQAAMSSTEARLIAARIDRDREATDLQLAEYQGLRDSLLIAADAVPLAAAEAVDALRADPSLRPATDGRGLRRAAKALVDAGVSAKDRRSWIANGLTREQEHDIELALTTPDFVPRPLDDLLNELPQNVAQIATAIQEESDAVLHPAPR
jgi:hypothetical protein